MQMEIAPQKRCVGGQDLHEKMLNIIGHQRDANQNLNKIPWASTKVAEIETTGKSECGSGWGDTETLIYCLET